jgi:tRNA-Thr(GGU) m(6)t(6)A37 methyltransferase TsaA
MDREVTATLECKPIGTVHSPFPEPEGVPIQPSRADGVEGTVELLPEFQEGLSDLDGFSHIVLVTWLHRSEGYRLKTVPFLDTEERGLFSTRSPRRPNPIGLSVVRLLSVDGCTLRVADLDLVDGTPVLDIKPYIEEFDRRPEFRSGWLERSKVKRREADQRFSDPDDQSS